MRREKWYNFASYAMARSGARRPLAVMAVGKELYMSAWNGPQSREAATAPQKTPNRGDKKPSALRGLVCGGIVVLGALAAAVWLFSAGETPPPQGEKVKESRRIKEVAPVPAPKAKEIKPEKPKLSPTQVMGKRGIPIETYGLKTYWTNGVLRYEGGLRVYDPNRPSKKVELRPPATEIFKRHSLNAIASIISHEPGDLLVGDLEYGDDFIKDFNDSLSEQIEYGEDDTEYTRQVKDAVKEVQKQLHEMMNQGKDIAEVMNEARNDLRNLSMYRQEIMSMVSETADNEEASDSDVEDIIAAANQMFRDKGVKEIGENEFVRWSLILEQRRNRMSDANKAPVNEEN